MATANERRDPADLERAIVRCQRARGDESLIASGEKLHATVREEMLVATMATVWKREYLTTSERLESPIDFRLALTRCRYVPGADKALIARADVLRRELQEEEQEEKQQRWEEERKMRIMCRR